MRRLLEYAARASAPPQRYLDSQAASQDTECKSKDLDFQMMMRRWRQA
ncbi:hypothetical protein HHJ78_09380 [Mobiluncus mulieris]|uniref:Uncharacterized protein n=1 Tax=Mobiluncus mulieris TaxID=2052 RepID=A0A7Y0Y515_9ACTO|nr:hypothetical protein [Mobiluncus mulieris]